MEYKEYEKDEVDIEMECDDYFDDDENEDILMFEDFVNNHKELKINFQENIEIQNNEEKICANEKKNKFTENFRTFPKGILKINMKEENKIENKENDVENFQKKLENVQNFIEKKKQESETKLILKKK